MYDENSRAFGAKVALHSEWECSPVFASIRSSSQSGRTLDDAEDDRSHETIDQLVNTDYGFVCCVEQLHHIIIVLLIVGHCLLAKTCSAFSYALCSPELCGYYLCNALPWSILKAAFRDNSLDEERTLGCNRLLRTYMCLGWGWLGIYK